MDFVKELGRKKNVSNEVVELQEKYAQLKAQFDEVTEFAEEVVEKHNDLLVKYNEKNDEIKKQKLINEDMQLKFKKLEKHVDSLIESHAVVNSELKRKDEVIQNLEKYIEIVEKSTKESIKNERGAGRKKKYSEQQINRILSLKDSEKDYIEIVDIMNNEFSEKNWDTKEIKYVYTRYKL